MELQSFKCKNCGAVMQATQNENGVLSCEYCGCEFTIPVKNSNSEVLQFLRMGEHYLDICRFDEAYTAFEKASQLNGKEPEAYWGMALATAKVQYLEDCVNNRLQPIVHEISGKKFAEDKNCKKAISLATNEQKQEYTKKANDIDDIHSKFADLKKSGLHYDCFICTKVSNENGGHTEDSHIASKLYHTLQAEGYFPFYSEEEIGTRTGSDYEAMILYALRTSPCMFIVCTNEEYLQTKWVKNEYTRYIKMMKDEDKERDSITFVFQDNVVEKLPGVNGKIQGISFNSFGASEKIKNFVARFAVTTAPEITRKEYKGNTYQKKTTIKQGVAKRKLNSASVGTVTVSDLSKLNMVKQFMARDKFDIANDMCKNLITENPSNSEAYWLLFLIENNCKTDSDFENICRKVNYETFENAIASCNDEKRKQEFYLILKKNIINNKNFDGYKEFIELPDSEDSDIAELSEIFYQRAIDRRDKEMFDEVIKTITDSDKYIEMNLAFAKRIGSDSKYWENILSVDEGHHEALLGLFKAKHSSNLSDFCLNVSNFAEIEEKLFAYGFNELAANELFSIVLKTIYYAKDNDNLNNACKLFDFIISMIPENKNSFLIDYLNKFVDSLFKNNYISKVSKYNEMLIALDKYDHNAYFTRVLLNYNLTNPIGLLNYADELMSNTDFYNAISVYSEKHPNNNIYMDIMESLLDLNYIAKTPVCYEYLVENVYVPKDNLAFCKETVLKALSNKAYKIYNETVKKYATSLDNIFRLEQDVSGDECWQLSKVFAEIAQEKDLFRKINDIIQNQGNKSKQNVEARQIAEEKRLAEQQRKESEKILENKKLKRRKIHVKAQNFFVIAIIIFAFTFFVTLCCAMSNSWNLLQYYTTVFGTAHIAILVIFLLIPILLIIIAIIAMSSVWYGFGKDIILQVGTKTELKAGYLSRRILMVITSLLFILTFSLTLTASIRTASAKANVGNYYMADTYSMVLDDLGNGECAIDKIMFGGNFVEIPEYCNGKKVVAIQDEAINPYRNYINNRSYTFKNIFISKSVNYISPNAFNFYISSVEDRPLNGIYITDISAWCNIDFELTSNNKIRTPIRLAENLFLNNEKVVKLVIPKQTEQIKQYTFSCGKFESVIIEENVEKIGGNAFSYCDKLLSVEIGNGTNVIEQSAFFDCVNLSQITIPNSLQHIKQYAFYSCKKLLTINYQGTIAEWEKIQKVNDWNYGTNNYKIYCTDGTIDKNGKVVDKYPNEPMPEPEPPELTKSY